MGPEKGSLLTPSTTSYNDIYLLELKMTQEQRLERLKELFTEAEVILREEFDYKTSMVNALEGSVHIHKELDEKKIKLVTLWKKQFTNKLKRR